MYDCYHYVVNKDEYNTPHSKRFPFDKTLREKISNARACDSQQRAAGVPQAIRTVLYFSASAGGVPAELRCDSLRRVTH